MKKKSLYFIIPALVLVAAYFIFAKSPSASENDIWVNVGKGEFQIEISTTGELEAKNSVKIQGPTSLRMARIWNVKIEKIVPEGTVVNKGDFIASLDRAELADRINNVRNELEQRESDYTQTKLDTAIRLRKLRDELVNKEYTVEERKLTLEQSKFEPPATIKQNELNLEKAIRELEQAEVNYQLEKEKAVEEMKKAYSRMMEEKNEVDFLNKLMMEMRISAPESGMVIYDRDRSGSRKGEGSMISPWDPTVATLPDLTKMISKTYINEVDIRKVKEGQPVKIGLDAFPEKKLTGSVISVANVGEQKPNSDAKVFEVTIEVNESDTTLRPAMTTSNVIIADVVKDALFVPLESIHSQGDSLTYVFKKSGLGIVKQEVMTGKTNSNEVIVEKGLADNDLVMLSLPNDIEKKKLVLLEGDEQELTSIK